MNKEDRVKIDAEVFEVILNNMKLYGIESGKEVFKFALAMFLEGVNYIPNKTKARLEEIK
jgi:hypothetical protein